MFHPSDNFFLDQLLPEVQPAHVPGWMATVGSISSSAFIESYLAYRSPPRLRPDPRRPFSLFDALVGEAVVCGPRLSPAHLLDAVVLFPKEVASCLLEGRRDDLVDELRELRSAVDGKEGTVVDALDVIANVARAGGKNIVIAALTTTQRVADVGTCLLRWRENSRMANLNEEELSFISRTCVEILMLLATENERCDIESLLLEMAPCATNEQVNQALARAGTNSESAMIALLDQGSENTSARLKPIGKKMGRLRHVHNVHDSETFSGVQAEPDGGYKWLQDRIEAEMTRQESIDPDDPRESKRLGPYTFLVAGALENGCEQHYMYDDDPDDALLVGETEIDVGPANFAASYGQKGWNSQTNMTAARSNSGTSSENEHDTDGEDASNWPRNSACRFADRKAPKDGKGDGTFWREEENTSVQQGRGNENQALGVRGGPRGSRGRSRGRGRGRGSFGRGGRRGAPNHDRREASARKQARGGF